MACAGCTINVGRAGATMISMEEAITNEGSASTNEEGATVDQERANNDEKRAITNKAGTTANEEAMIGAEAEEGN